jgi:hypothetical protein
MGTLKEQVQSILDRFNVGLSVEEPKMATAVLDSGQTIQTDSDAFVAGANVFIVNDEGEQVPLPDGSYTMEDGTQIAVAEGVIVEQEVEEQEVEASQDLSEAIRPIVAEMLAAALEPIVERLEGLHSQNLSAQEKPLPRVAKPVRKAEAVDLTALSMDERIKAIQKQYQ